IPDDEGFGWKVNKLPATKVAFEKSEGHTGVASLRINWAGNPATSDETISQLVIVEPSANYKLEFAARAQNLISGGAPIIDVTDVSDPKGTKLGQSTLLP